MDRWLAMDAFVRVVESGSFVAAAERLGLSTSSLSRLVAELEQHLGARLLNRTTRRLSLTESGQSYYERCVTLLADLAEAEAIAGQAAAEPRGTIRLTCSFSMAEQRVAPAIATFSETHALVKFELVVSDRMVDLVEEGFDLAIRVGPVGSDRLVARRLGSMQGLLCAAPSYLARHGTPAAPGDLVRFNTLTYAYASAPRQWTFTDRDGRPHEVRVSGTLHANSGDALRSAAIRGLGIIYEPDFLLQDALRQGELVRLLPDYEGSRGDIWAVYPSRRHLSLKVRLFVDHIAAAFTAAAIADSALQQ
ncbi:MAG TPA: LysR family transcriptional regulator [Burkholderiaceae bacterium]|nr:LysR family transcriptional regulator [Burkholderiaceae bacterium]